MNDVIPWRWCSALLLAACAGDPTLDIAVDHPGGFAVAQTVVTAYAGGDISCSQIEYGDRTDEELAAITVDEVDVSHGGSVLVSRLGSKSLVARGFDAQHRFVTAGCQDVGEISGAMRVKIAAQPTAVVAIDPGSPDLPFAQRTILVNMTDTHGKPLDGTVSWLLSGPAGAPEQQPSAGMATVNGNVQIGVMDLGVPGPEGLRIRAPWATAPLPLVTAFDLTHPTQIPLAGGAQLSHPSCDLRGHTGKPPTLVCLTPANVQGHRDAVEISWQNGFTSTPLITVGNNQFALFVDHDGSANEPVYVLGVDQTTGTGGSWYRLGAGSATAVTFAGALDDVVYIPKCSGGSNALVAVQTRPPGADLTLPRSFALFSPVGASLVDAVVGEVSSGGCIADVDKREHQAMVVARDTGDPGLELISNDGKGHTAIPSTRLTGSGFIVAESQGTTEKQLAGTRLQATGTVVFQAVLAPAGSSFMLIERSEVEAAAPPSKILGGKLDRDGDTDLMWDIAANTRRRVFQVSLAKHVSGVPLTAITGGQPTSGAVALTAGFMVGNLDSGPTDEMILFTQSNVTVYSADE